MLRRFARALIVVCLLVPMTASPLGLGDIVLRSALNQPLNAEIPLTAPGQVQSEDIVVRLASVAAFESAGLDRSLLLTTLNFQVLAGVDGTPYIKVTSADPVKEPFLDFLVEIDWPSGHLLREYTLLLDPPVVIDEEPLPVEAAFAGEAAAIPADSGMQESAPAAVQPQAAEPTASVSSAGLLSYGPVQRSDTLWSIASQLQQAGDAASVEQIMMALLKGNPEAFYNDNINELKAGYVLRVSDPALLTAMTRAAAIAEVRRQNEQWMDSKQARAGMAGAAPQGVPAEAMGDAATGAAGNGGPRLRLSVPEATATGMALEGVAGEGEAAASPASEMVRLKAELAAALETSEASRQENSELRERLATLQEQIDAMQRLTTLQDDTLAALQTGAGESDAAGAVATTAGEPAKGDKAAGEAAGGEASRKPARPAREQAAGSLLDDPKILAVGVTAAAALLGLVWLVIRRRRGARLLDEMTIGEPAHDIYAGAPAWATAAESQTTAAPAPQASAGAESAATTESEESGLDLMQAEEDEIDVLAEADVYLAYRRFDKAEELLREAIKVEPGRRDLVLKLLEVQAAAGNRDAFVAQAEAFKQSLGSGDAALWDKVLALGKRVAPQHALFGGSALTAAVAAGGDAGMDLGAELSALELDADLAAELDKLDGEAQPSVAADGPDVPHIPDASLHDMDLSLDEHALSDLGGIDLGGPATETPRASDPPSARTFGSASNVIDFESRTGLGQAVVDEAGDRPAAAAGGGVDRDLDWLTGVGDDLDSLGETADAAEDDFSSLISGEDEVGTKLDLAKAYIDMGDQDSARNILSEVVQEGTQDQQREANELMRQIG